MTSLPSTPHAERLIAQLQQEIASLKQDNQDLQLTLQATVEHGDIIEDQLHKATTQLARANQEITALNEGLKAENLRMGAELDIARRLQQMILPSDKELSKIKELDVAGFMKPAEDVGGDYYDVITQNGRLIVAIGDVTGHGLESGVMMLMVQTAVRALIANQETDPVRFFSALNATLYANMRRMRSDKMLTLLLLDYKDGVLRCSGQHEDVVVVRADGRIERIDTFDLGFPLGLEPSIGAFIDQIILPLDRGDVVVVYTDGITEAMNTQNEQYGIERLCQVIQNQRHLSAQMIQRAIISAVLRHIGNQKIWDDMTLVVLKQR